MHGKDNLFFTASMEPQFENQIWAQKADLKNDHLPKYQSIAKEEFPGAVEGENKGRRRKEEREKVDKKEPKGRDGGAPAAARELRGGPRTDRGRAPEARGGTKPCRFSALSANILANFASRRRNKIKNVQILRGVPPRLYRRRFLQVNAQFEAFFAIRF